MHYNIILREYIDAESSTGASMMRLEMDRSYWRRAARIIF